MNNNTESKKNENIIKSSWEQCSESIYQGTTYEELPLSIDNVLSNIFDNSNSYTSFDSYSSNNNFTSRINSKLSNKNWSEYIVDLDKNAPNHEYNY